MTLPPILTIVQAADYLHLNRRTVAKLIRAGELRGGLYMGRWRITREALVDYQLEQERIIREGDANARKAE